MTLDKYERLIKKFTTHQSWENVEARWLNYIPAIDPLGTAPEISVQDFDNFKTVARPLVYNESLSFTRTDISGIRPMVLHEGIFWIHKALHVLGIAEKRAVARQVTWGLSDGYHAALFSVRAILSFWGIAMPVIAMKTVLIDIWTEPDPLSSKAKRRGDSPQPIVQLAKLDLQAGHVHVWLLFQRLLRINDIPIWDRKTIDLLTDVDHSVFTDQRNALHYVSAEWLYPDLFEPIKIEDYSFDTSDLERCLTTDNLQSELSLTLGITLVRLAILMFRSIADKSPTLKPEFDYLESYMKPTHHPYIVPV